MPAEIFKIGISILQGWIQNSRDPFGGGSLNPSPDNALTSTEAMALPLPILEIYGLNDA